MLNSFRALQHTFIDEDQLLRIEIELTIKPDAPALQDIRPVLLQCVCGLFLKILGLEARRQVRYG